MSIGISVLSRTSLYSFSHCGFPLCCCCCFSFLSLFLWFYCGFFSCDKWNIIEKKISINSKDWYTAVEKNKINKLAAFKFFGRVYIVWPNFFSLLIFSFFYCIIITKKSFQSKEFLFNTLYESNADWKKIRVKLTNTMPFSWVPVIYLFVLTDNKKSTSTIDACKILKSNTIRITTTKTTAAAAATVNAHSHLYAFIRSIEYDL